jgi:hypothetical protein
VAIKACKDVAFSNGGQYFAAVNGITLSLYNTYTCECLGNLRGHNGKVRATLQHHMRHACALFLSCIPQTLLFMHCRLL